MTHNIEDHEIKGISLKTVRWAIGQTIIICMALAASYYGIQKRLDGFTSHAMLQDLQIKTVQIQLEKQQTEIETLQTRLESMQIDIERMKTKLGINE